MAIGVGNRYKVDRDLRTTIKETGFFTLSVDYSASFRKKTRFLATRAIANC